MANVIFNKVIAKDGKTARERYAEMVKQDGVFYLVEDDLYLKDLLLSTEIASKIGVTDVAAYFEGETVEEVLAELAEMSADKTLWFHDDSAGQSEYAKVYNLYQGSNDYVPDRHDGKENPTLIGTINLPKDQVVKDGYVVNIAYDNGKLYDKTIFTTAYIVGVTPFAADWLSDEDGGAPITPEEGVVYKIATAGDYKDKMYSWDDSGAAYVLNTLGTDVTEYIKGAGGTATEDDAGTYIKLELQNVDAPLYIAIKDFAAVYTGGTTPEATVQISNSNEITVTLNKVNATKVIYRAGAPEEYIRVEDGDTFDEEAQYYTYDSLAETYVLDTTVNASNFDDKVAAGLYYYVEPVAEINVKDKVDQIESDLRTEVARVGEIPETSQAQTIVDYVDEKAGAGTGSLNGEATIASKSGKAVILKGGVVEVEGIISNSPTSIHAYTENGYYDDGRFYEEPLIAGYLNSADGKFYTEDTYQTEIVGEAGKVYIDLTSEVTYIWNSTAFVEGSRTQIVPIETKTYIDVSTYKKYNWTGHAYIEVVTDITLADVAATGLAEDVAYDNSVSYMTATNVQAAIDELKDAMTWDEV